MINDNNWGRACLYTAPIVFFTLASKLYGERVCIEQFYFYGHRIDCLIRKGWKVS